MSSLTPRTDEILSLASLTPVTARSRLELAHDHLSSAESTVKVCSIRVAAGQQRLPDRPGIRARYTWKPRPRAGGSKVRGVSNE